MGRLIEIAIKESIELVKPIPSDVQEAIRGLSVAKQFIRENVFSDKATTQIFGSALKLIDEVFPMLEEINQATKKSIDWQLAVLDELKDEEEL